MGIKRKNKMDLIEKITEVEAKELELLQSNIEKAFDLVYKNDEFLITNGLCERCIMFRFADYLADLYPNYNVDCEYNRHIENVKRISKDEEIFPDVILHTRGVDDNNFAIIELKNKTNPGNSGRKNDEKKLRALTKSKSDGNKDSLYNYGYKFGLAITICEDLKATMNSIDVYRNGKKISQDSKN